MVTSVAASSPKAASDPGNDNRIDREDAVKPYIPIGVAVVGVIGIYIAHRLSTRRERLSRFHAAAAKFRDAFAPELAAAEADSRNDINYMDFLRAAYERHALAIIAFDAFILEDKRRSFNNAWNRYRYGENADGSTQAPDPHDMDHESLYFLEYSIEWDLSRPKRPRENTIKRIRTLLSYTK